MTFESELKALCTKYGVYLDGSVRVRKGGDWDSKTFQIENAKEINYGYAKDKSGPFIICSISQKPKEAENCKIEKRVYALPDYPAYECPVTGKMVDGRKDHRENLKRTGCRILEKGEREHNEKRKREEVNESTAKSARMIAENIAQNWGC